MTLQAVLTSPWAMRWGAALLESFWQGALVAVLAWIALALARGARPQVRYLTACAALATLAVLPLVMLISTPAPAPPAAAASSAASAAAPNVRGLIRLLHLVATRSAASRESAAPAGSSPNGASRSSAVASDRSAGSDKSDPSVERKAQSMDAPASPRPAPAVAWTESFAGRLDTTLPWIVLVWLAGVALLGARNLVGLFLARRLRLRGVRPVEAHWQEQFERLCERLRLRRAVALLESALVEAPSLVGWMKPAILMPACALTGITPEQFEAVLAHELAHIRRHDYLVNLIQSVIETLLFHHPAVWWLSHRIRVEREYCCDQDVLRADVRPGTYARALLSLEERRMRLPVPALGLLGADGGALKHRIERILDGGLRRREALLSSRSWAGALTLLALLFIAAASLASHASRAKAAPQAGAGATGASAPSTRAQGPEITIFTKGSPLKLLCARLAELSGHAIHYPAGWDEQTVDLDDAYQEPLEHFLDRLVRSKGWRWEKEADGSYQIAAATPGAAPTQQSTPSPSPAPAASLPITPIAPAQGTPAAKLKDLPGYVDFDATSIIEKADTKLNVNLDPLTLKMLLSGAQQLDPEIKDVLTKLGLQSVRVQFGDGLPADDGSGKGEAELKKIKDTIAALKEHGWSPLFDLNESGDGQLTILVRPLDADNLAGIVGFYIADDQFGFGNVVGTIDAAELGKHLGSLTGKFVGGKLDLSQLGALLEGSGLNLSTAAPSPASIIDLKVSQEMTIPGTNDRIRLNGILTRSAAGGAAGPRAFLKITTAGGAEGTLDLFDKATGSVADYTCTVMSIRPDERGGAAAAIRVTRTAASPAAAPRGSAPSTTATQHGPAPAGEDSANAPSGRAAPSLQPASPPSPAPPAVNVALKQGVPVPFNDVRLRLDAVREITHPDGSKYHQIDFKVLGADSNAIADVSLAPYGSAPLVQNRFRFSAVESKLDAGGHATATIRAQVTNVPAEAGASLSINEGAEIRLPRATIHLDAIVAPGAAGADGQAGPPVAMAKLTAQSHDASSTSGHLFTLPEHTSELVAGYEIRLEKATPGNGSGMAGSASFHLVDLETKNPG